MDPLEITILSIFIISKAPLAVKFDVQSNRDVKNGCIKDSVFFSQARESLEFSCIKEKGSRRKSSRQSLTNLRI